MIRMNKSFFRKLINRQTILYSFFGLLTTILNIILFQVLTASMDYKSANIITLVIVKLVSYIVNKCYVFRSSAVTFWAICKEFGMFMVTRGFTMLIDFFGVILFVEVLGFDPKLSKYFFVAIIVVINYFFGIKVFKSDIRKAE